MKTGNYQYLIVGAGLFGSIFAHEAARKGHRCLVIDKRDHIGGNLYTYQEDGITVHQYGAHIFHTDSKEIWAYMNRFADFIPFTNQVLANYQDQLYNLPFNMNTFYQLWGVRTPAEAQEEIKQQIESAGITGKPKNLEEQAIQLVGTDIYRKLIAGYTQKQWGKPLASCRALSFVDCRFVSPMITIISTIGFKEFPKVAIRRFSRNY